MLRRLATLAVGVALTVGLASPAVAQPTTPSVASQAAAIEARYPGIHFAHPADVVALAPALAALSPNSVPPPDPSHEYTIAQFNGHQVGKRIGPNAYTYNGEFTITGWVQSGKYWVRTRSTVTCPVCTTSGLNPQAVTPDGLPRWANPADWDWGSILGKVWFTFWDNCGKGALTGLIGTATTTVATNLVAVGAKTFVGPYGYAMMAVGGCIMNLVNN